MVQTRRRLPRHGHAVDSIRRLLPQILANEACATKDRIVGYWTARFKSANRGRRRRRASAESPQGQPYMPATALKDLRGFAHR